MSRIRTALALSLAATAVAVTACSSSGDSDSGSSDTSLSGTSAAAVVVPTSVPAGTTLQVADQLNVLETPLKLAGQDQGIPYTVKYSNFVGGPPMLQAIQAGQVDLGWVADAPLVFAQAANQGVVAVAGYANETATQLLIADPTKGIKSWADLKGKSVAYQQGTSLESVLLLGLQTAGLTLKDIKPVNVTATEVISALQAGKVDAAISSQPLTAGYIAKEPRVPQIPVPTNDITTRASFLIASASALKNPAKAAAIADYVSRFVKAVGWENSHVSEVAKATYVDQYKLPQALGESIIKAAGPSTFIQLPGDLLAPQQNLADLYATAGEIPEKLDVSAEFSTLYNDTVKAAQAGSAS
jgi:sulfonate transport system substrate-binding protein